MDVEQGVDAPVSRGLGVMVAGDDGYAHLRGFGRGASPRAFGHTGAPGQVGWGDPETGISMGYCTNGLLLGDNWMPVLERRWEAVSGAAATCAL